MTEYLLDTNVVSELRKPKPHGDVQAWLRDQPDESLFISAVTIGEMQVGIERTRRHDSVKATELERWVEHVATSSQVLPMDVHCFREWSRLMHGKSDDLLQDAMIAATARIHHLTVVTRNERDFRHFGVALVNPFTLK